MNTEDDVELLELEVIEQRLNTEGRGDASQERASSGSFGIAPGSGFEIA